VNSSAPWQGASALYVDADVEAGLAIPRFLRRVVEVREARSLAEARAAIKTAMPPLLVLDPDLPDGDGLELVREVSRDAPWVRIFPMLGGERAHQTAEFIAAGASDIATKPFDVGSIPARAGRLLRAAEQAYREHQYRLQLEERLAHAERIGVLGTLCATVAHEIANPLTLIVANAASMYRTLSRARQLDPDEIANLGEGMQEIQTASSMIEAFIARIRNFSRRNDERFVDAPLADVVDTALLLLKPRIATRVISIERPTNESPSVPHLPIRLTQALLNLLTNAIDAAPNGGHVRIELEEDADSALIVVEDDGPGILPEHAASLGELPFFTTKPQGTGLGILVVRTIMREHEGRFEITARADGRSGARAVLRLPRTRVASAS
jgi:C4-dicarboxylate-specific signal transduction histidine kinase